MIMRSRYFFAWYGRLGAAACATRRSSVTRIQVLTHITFTHSLAHCVIVTSLRKKTMAVGT